VIGLTAPGGKLAAGVYDVCTTRARTASTTPGGNTILHDAVKVLLPLQLPDSGGAIGAIKDQARREYSSWLATRFAMNGIFELADKAINLQCDIGNPIGCAMKELDYFSGIKERFMALMLSESNHCLAIAEDPPDANYQTLTTVEPPAFPEGHSDSALPNATADALGPLDREAALNAALLHDRRARSAAERRRRRRGRTRPGDRSRARVREPRGEHGVEPRRAPDAP
jgi:hypothetical protein